MHFYKYQGTGNDFIMIDNRDGHFQATTEAIAGYCHRRFGVGADGLILLENDPGYDFRMVYYNADGREGTMCGNGGRCLVKFAFDLGVIGNKTTFIAVDGEHEAEVTGDVVRLKMMQPQDVHFLENGMFINTGSPHLLVDAINLKELDVAAEGKAIRYSSYWEPKGGVNVNFMETAAPGRLNVRTYERGVEDETYSCGTGVTAAALYAYIQQNMQPPVKITTKGGALEVDFKHLEDYEFADVYLSGPAVKVFEGDC